MEYLSKEKHKEYSDELDYLINTVYPKVREELAEMSEQGDRSENYGYRAARRTQGKVIGRIKFLQKILRYSRIIDTKALPKEVVSLLSKVEFTILSTGAKMCYTVVSPHEMNLEKGKISIKSPIGEALMGKKVGEEIEVKAPSSSFKIRIESITAPE